MFEGLFTSAKNKKKTKNNKKKKGGAIAIEIAYRVSTNQLKTFKLSDFKNDKRFAGSDVSNILAGVIIENTFTSVLDMLLVIVEQQTGNLTGHNQTASISQEQCENAINSSTANTTNRGNNNQRNQNQNININNNNNNNQNNNTNGNTDKYGIKWQGL